MASTLAKSSILVLLFLIFNIALGADDGFSKALDPNTVTQMKEKLTQIRFYWHDVLSGRNPTAVKVIEPPSKISMTQFGEMFVIDDPLTIAPDMSSKLVGRAQGFYTSASQQDLGLMMSMNFAFMEGEYNGSTIAILGRNAIFSDVREMPVIGGSGLFRFAKGYVQAKTYKADMLTGDAIVEYNVFVMHY